MDMDWNNKETQMWIIGGIVVVIILVAGWWFFTKPVSDSGPAMATTTQNGNTGNSTTTSNGQSTVDTNPGEEVMADDQPAGDSVRVVNAKLSRVSWLAVRDDMRIYGAARVNPPNGAGSVNDITIPLLRNTEAGKTYKVVVYADDGDGVFDFHKDALVDGLDDSFSALNGD